VCLHLPPENRIAPNNKGGQEPDAARDTAAIHGSRDTCGASTSDGGGRSRPALDVKSFPVWRNSGLDWNDLCA